MTLLLEAALFLMPILYHMPAAFVMAFRNEKRAGDENRTRIISLEG